MTYGSGDVISGDVISGDATSGRACARDHFQYPHTSPPQMISGWCFYTTGNGTLLDPVLISAECNVTFSEVIDVCREKSDHNATKISLQISNYLQKTYQRTIWMYKNANFEKFNKLIRQFNREESRFTLVNDIDEIGGFLYK